MARSLIYITIVWVGILRCVECRPQNFDVLKTLNAGKDEDWKQDKAYSFGWKGAFALGVPEHAKCPLVMQPAAGRFVCSIGTLIERNMCLVECQIGFEQDKPPVVYICEKGQWKDLRNRPIETPEPLCVPKPVQKRQFAE